MVFLNESESVQNFFYCLFISVAIGDPFIKRGIPLTGLKAPHFRACLKPGSGFSMSHVFVFIVLNGLRWMFILLILAELLTITV